MEKRSLGAWRRPENWEKIPKSLSNRSAGWKKRSGIFQLAELIKRVEAPKLNELNPQIKWVEAPKLNGLSPQIKWAESPKLNGLNPPN